MYTHICINAFQTVPSGADACSNNCCERLALHIPSWLSAAKPLEAFYVLWAHGAA